MITLLRNVSCALAILMIYSCPVLANGLRICADSWHPYEFVENSRVKGFSVEVVSEVLARMKQSKAEFVSASWPRCLESVESGSLDAAVSALKSSERAQYAYYPDEPLVVTSWVLFVHRERLGQLGFKRLIDLEGDTIGVVNGFYYPPDFLRYAKEHAVLCEAPSTMNNFKKLMALRLDYVFDDLAAGIYILRKLHALNKVVPLRETELAAEPLYIMFSKKTVPQVFVEEFSRTLKEFKESKEYAQIYSRYMDWQ